MKTIYFITHPNVDVTPNTPPNMWNLSEQGNERVHNLTKEDWWKYVQFIVSSNESRALQTLDIIKERYNIPSQVFYPLEEQRRSNTNYYLSLTDLAITMRMFFSRPKESIRGWESAVDAQQRIVTAIETIQELYPQYQTIAIISHGIVGSLLRSYLMHHPIEESLCQDKIGSYIQIDWEHQCVVSDDWLTY